MNPDESEAVSTSRVKNLAFPALLALLAAAVFASLWAYMQSLERRALSSPMIRDQILASGRVRPLADVAKVIARMQLVTAEVQTTVQTQMSDENWRGLASATVEAPARILYGVDVSDINVRSVSYSPAESTYLIRIPPPRRMATEVCGDDEKIKVQVGWARLRSIAGEYYLGLARKALYTKARELTLKPDDAARIRETTLTQVKETVQHLVGPDAVVHVIFDDTMPVIADAPEPEREGAAP